MAENQFVSLKKSLWAQRKVSEGRCEIRKTAIALLWAKDEGKRQAVSGEEGSE